MNLLRFCLNDINREYVNDLQRLGYTEISTRKLEDLAIHGVSKDYIKQIHDLGFKDISVAKLLSFRIH